ncbi:MAG: hypothetical protein FJ126_04650 [Deltaproteobacteria bacterium]|nr:hypothetical protein [Deltaproteobacteria bacterium]
MKPIKDMSTGELAAFVSSHLKRHGIEVVLSGGSCVSIYTHNKYSSLDLDFIEIGHVGRRKLKKALLEIGFHEVNKYFINTETDFFLEFPSGPLSIGEEPVKEIVTLSFPTGQLRIISPTDCVKDRLAAYYHWGDRQSLEQAVLVAKDNKINLNELERWSEVEGKLAIFHQIKDRFIEAD